MFDVIGVGANSVDYVYRLPRFPQPDGPAAKLRISYHTVSCGGQTATTLCTCAAMGLTTRYVGATGSDDKGQLIRDALVDRGVDIAQSVESDGGNAFAVILLDQRQGERVVLWDRPAGLDLAPGDIHPDVICDTRLLHVDDVDIDTAIRAASLARAAGIPVTSDIERVDERVEELVAAVTVPIFAEHVLESLTGEQDVERALRSLRKRHAGLLCVTLGGRGAMLLDGDRLHQQPAFPVPVVDTTGAGDVFRGAFIAAMLRGGIPPEILRFANAAAAISCTRVGAIGGIPTRAETQALAGT
jgi:sugar/nucleoside kinase (ribokinase family)